MIRLEIDWPDGTIVEMGMDEETLQWTCLRFPSLARMATSLSVLAVMQTRAADGDPLIAAFNEVAALFDPGSEIVNGKQLSDLVY